MKKQAILLASAGTGSPDSSRDVYSLMKREVAAQFPDYELREAFTGSRAMQKQKEASGLEVNHVERSLERAAADGIRRLIVQPLHLMHGHEYRKLVIALRERGRYFTQVVLGEPLLSRETDFTAVLGAIVQRTMAFEDGRTAVCLVGHGSGAGSKTDTDDVYGRMQDKLIQAGYKNYYVGVLKGTPSDQDILNAMQERKRYHRVVLLPFMVAAANHARRDIAGEQVGSWRRVLEQAGYETICILEGLGQLSQVRELYVEHIKNCQKSICTSRSEF